MSDLPLRIKSIQKKIDAFLVGYLREKEQSVLVSEVTRMVESGGKRLRPFILYSTYELLGGKDEHLVIKIGAAIELFHTFALIHDDIIDKSDLRRNVPTVRNAVGDSTAILVGDVCLGFANDIFSNTLLNSRLSDLVKISLQNRWQQMQEEVITGEYLDSDQTIFEIINKEIEVNKLEEKSMKIMDYKTARYTIVHPLLFAATLVGAKEDTHGYLSEYGTKLGIAFQIKDDLLGIFGDEKTIGKPIDSDVKEGKITLLVVELLKKLPQKERTRENLANIHFVGEKMRLLGIDKTFENRIKDYTQQAIAELDKTSLGKKEKQFFEDFAYLIISRNK